VNLRPVKVGDTLHAHCRVGDKFELANGKAVIRRDVRVFNQRDELVQEGWHEMESPRRPGGSA
jgi:acyl dehydratase